MINKPHLHSFLLCVCLSGVLDSRETPECQRVIRFQPLNYCLPAVRFLSLLTMPYKKKKVSTLSPQLRNYRLKPDNRVKNHIIIEKKKNANSANFRSWLFNTKTAANKFAILTELQFWLFQEITHTIFILNEYLKYVKLLKKWSEILVSDFLRERYYRYKLYSTST